jgi:hypothetical protein
MILILLLSVVSASNFILDNNIDENVLYMRDVNDSSIVIIKQSCTKSSIIRCCMHTDLTYMIENKIINTITYQSADSYIIYKNYKILLESNTFIYKLNSTNQYAQWIYVINQPNTELINGVYLYNATKLYSIELINDNNFTYILVTLVEKSMVFITTHSKELQNTTELSSDLLLLTLSISIMAKSNNIGLCNSRQLLMDKIAGSLVITVIILFPISLIGCYLYSRRDRAKELPSFSSVMGDEKKLEEFNTRSELITQSNLELANIPELTEEPPQKYTLSNEKKNTKLEKIEEKIYKLVKSSSEPDLNRSRHNISRYLPLDKNVPFGILFDTKNLQASGTSSSVVSSITPTNISEINDNDSWTPVQTSSEVTSREMSRKPSLVSISDLFAHSQIQSNEVFARTGSSTNEVFARTGSSTSNPDTIHADQT